MNEELRVWSKVIAEWASGNPSVAEVWIFGSRARGDNREDSDLDVALIMSESDKGIRDSNVLCNSDEWQEALQMLLPVQLHLECGDRDFSPDKVGPAVEKDGLLIFRRGEET